MKRLVLLLTLVLTIIFSAILLSGCNRRDEREENEVLISRDKVYYINIFQFETRIVIDGEVVITPSITIEIYGRIFGHIYPTVEPPDPSFTELVFVHSAEEAEGFPDNVIVAWPSRLTYHFIPGIYRSVDRSEEEIAEWRASQRRDVITFEEFGLSYPLTIEDFIDNWENMYKLWQALYGAEQSTIIHIARIELAEELEGEGG